MYENAQGAVCLFFTSVTFGFRLNKIDTPQNTYLFELTRNGCPNHHLKS